MPAPTRVPDNPNLADSSLLQHAIAFAVAADSYAATRSPDWFVLHFLLGRAIELALKAHAITTGASDSELRTRLKHSLARALKRADVHGLNANIDEHERAAILAMDHWYERKMLEYPEIQGYTVPNTRILRMALDNILRASFESLWGRPRFVLGHDTKRTPGLCLMDAECYGPDPRVDTRDAAEREIDDLL